LAAHLALALTLARCPLPSLSPQLRVMPQSALTFLVYETVLRQLGGGGTDDAEGAV
jgi:hypothetical protein